MSHEIDMHSFIMFHMFSLGCSNVSASEGEGTSRFPSRVRLDARGWELAAFLTPWPQTNKVEERRKEPNNYVPFGFLFHVNVEKVT